MSGTVTYGGDPLPYGTVQFYKDGGSPVVSAAIDENGDYQLEALEGIHRVTIYAVPRLESDPTATAYEGGVLPNARAEGPTVSGRCVDVGTTPFECEVTPGEPVVFDIPIPAPKKRR